MAVSSPLINLAKFKRSVFFFFLKIKGLEFLQNALSQFSSLRPTTPEEKRTN